mgnify:CR=1 FL=1
MFMIIVYARALTQTNTYDVLMQEKEEKEKEALREQAQGTAHALQSCGFFDIVCTSLQPLDAALAAAAAAALLARILSRKISRFLLHTYQ